MTVSGMCLGMYVLSINQCSVDTWYIQYTIGGSSLVAVGVGIVDEMKSYRDRRYTGKYAIGQSA